MEQSKRYKGKFRKIKQNLYEYKPDLVLADGSQFLVVSEIQTISKNNILL
jgi:hypothetical protein